MNGPRPVPITGVTGGSHGLAATYDAVRDLAQGYHAAGSTMRDWAALGARTVADPDLVASGALAPVTFAEAEAAVLAATAGPDGVLTESLAWEADAILVRTTVAALEEADRLVRAAVEAIDNAIGRCTGFALAAGAVSLLPMLATGAVVAAHAWPAVPPAARRRLLRERDEAAAELDEWLVRHPAVVQHAVDGGGGLLEGLWDGLTPLVPGGPLGTPLPAPDTGSAAALLAALYDDGSARTVPVDRPVPSGDVQPGDVRGLLSHLRHVAALSPEPDSLLNGTVEVQTITDPGGGTRHIVYIPGTDDLTTLPWTQDDDVRDMGTNLRLVAGRDNAYQRGILDAMAQAGIGPEDPVLLVGHSQGGMEAAAILSQGSGYHVTDVVTAGSPTAQVDGFPAGSHVLSLENRGDVVPLLDGADNPDSVEQVTVEVAAGGDGVIGHHEYAPYLAGAAAVDASTDPSVVDQVASLRSHGYLASGATGAVVTSRVYQVVRER